MSELLSNPKGRKSEIIPIGSKFFRWTVIDQPEPGYSIYIVKCECGTTKQINGGALLSLRSTQCMKCRRADLKKSGGKFYGDL